jgi:hypothetical protein
MRNVGARFKVKVLSFKTGFGNGEVTRILYPSLLMHKRCAPFVNLNESTAKINWTSIPALQV